MSIIIFLFLAWFMITISYALALSCAAGDFRLFIRPVSGVSLLRRTGCQDGCAPGTRRPPPTTAIAPRPTHSLVEGRGPLVLSSLNPRLFS